MMRKRASALAMTQASAALKVGTLSIRVAVFRAAFETLAKIAVFSVFDAAQRKSKFTVAVTAVLVRTTAIDVGLEAASCASGASYLQALVFRLTATAFGNVHAGIAFETALYSSGKNSLLECNS